MKLKINRGFENKLYIGIVGFLGITYLIFFTSKLWMYDDNPINQTPFHTEIAGLEQTKLILNKWEYNPDKELMEVMIEMKHTGSDTVKPTFAFGAKASKSLDEYPVKVVYQDDNSVVLHINNVPVKYKVVGLFVKEIRDKKILESEARDQLQMTNGSLNQDGQEVKLVLPKPKEKVLIGDYRKIKINKELHKKSEVDYQLERLELELKQLVKEIYVLEKEQVPLQDEIISDIEKEIVQMENEMTYKTESEKQEVRNQISKKKTAIENAKEKQTNYTKEANELREKRKMLLVKIETIRSSEKKSAVVETAKEGK